MEAGLCSLCRRTQAKFSCSCVIPTISICAACLPIHIETEGRHRPVSIQPKAAPSAIPIEGNYLCDVCRDKVIVTGTMDIDKFVKKQNCIFALEFELDRELSKFDAFARQVEREFESVLSQVAVKKAAVARDLHALREKLTAVLSQSHEIISSKRLLPTFQVESPLDEYILKGYLTNSLYEIGVFVADSKLSTFNEVLEKAVTFDVFPSLLQEYPKAIPVPKGNTLRLYNRITLQQTQLTLNRNTKIDIHTSYCYISADTLLCCGCSGGGTNEVYEVNVRTGKVDNAPNMNFPRGVVGIWNYQGKYVYVFGGQNVNYSTNGEKYELATKVVWTNLPNPMQTPKYCCSVCEHSSGLYISGCETAGISVEFFNIQDETFKLLHTDGLRFVPIIVVSEMSSTLSRATQ